MISTLINIMDAAVTLPIATRNGLCELRPNPSGGTYPVMHKGKGNFVPVADDTKGSWSYWRILNDGLQRDVADVKAACEGVRYTMRLRLVMMIDREGPCEDVTTAMMTAANGVRGVSKQLRTAVGAINVGFPTVGMMVGGVDTQEFGSAGKAIPTNRSLIAMDFTMNILGTEGCLVNCN